MPRYNINRQTYLAVKLIDLRRHLNQCYKCRAAIRGGTPEDLCDTSIMLVCEIAIKWDGNIAGRLQGKRSDQGLQFACPDPNAHGPAYAATAEAIHVVGVQGSLF